ncbi:MAG: lytic transglycosylase domain-containing protein [Gammaproteobacteria bacterium]
MTFAHQKGIRMTAFSRSARLTFPAVAVALFAVAAPATDGRASTGAAARPDLCANAVAAQEKRHGIPKRLLTAISLVESGRWDAKAGKGAAWPWTVTAQGKGRFFPTKAAAIAAVKRLRAGGITSIDVGCMQVNLHFHPTAFKSLSAAFDPAQNASYAATFLTDLKRDHGSWQRAVQHYHSSTAKKRIPYQKKVYAAWRGTKATDDRAGGRADTGRIRRISREVERDHRFKLSAYRRGQRGTATVSSDKDSESRRPRFIASWPPRNAREQFRAQNLARAWAFGGAARNIRPSITPR